MKTWDRLTADWIAAADAFLLGRRTYELFAGHWAQVTDPDDPRATRLNGLAKYVVSDTLDRLEWNSAILLRGNVFEKVTELKGQPGNELQVHGAPHSSGHSCSTTLSTNTGLLMHPVVLGNGNRLFADGTIPTALSLIDTKTTSRGVVVHIHRPAGRPVTARAARRRSPRGE